MRRRSRGRGQILAWYAIVLALVLLPVAGLVIDSGILFNAHRKLQMVADGAARNAAMQLNTSALYDGDHVALDPAQAEAAAQAYLASIPGVTGTAVATVDRVDVQAARTVVLPFESAFGRPPIAIAAHAAAVPCPGIQQAEGAC